MADVAEQALALEIDTIAGAKPTPSERMRHIAAMAAKADTLRAYRRTFLDPETGELHHDARLVLEDLATAAGLGKAFGYGGGIEELNAREGKRALLLHLFARLGRQKLRRLAQKMREKTDG